MFCVYNSKDGCLQLFLQKYLELDIIESIGWISKKRYDEFEYCNFSVVTLFLLEILMFFHTIPYLYIKEILHEMINLCIYLSPLQL